MKPDIKKQNELLEKWKYSESNHRPINTSLILDYINKREEQIMDIWDKHSNDEIEYNSGLLDGLKDEIKTLHGLINMIEHQREFDPYRYKDNMVINYLEETDMFGKRLFQYLKSKGV